MKKILKYFSSDDFIFKSQVSFTIIIFIQILFVFLILVPFCRADSVAMIGFGPGLEADGFVGNQCSSLSSSNEIAAVDKAAGQAWTTVTPGTIGYIHVALDYTNDTYLYNVAVYSSDGSTKIAESNLTYYSGAWTTFQLDTTFTAETGVSYLLICGSKTDSSWRWVDKSGDGNTTETYNNITADIEDTMPNSITPGTTVGLDMCIYGDNTP